MEVLKLLGLSSLGESPSLLEELKPAVYAFKYHFHLLLENYPLAYHLFCH